jgi:ABC-type multidrug transport system ATPase subunit
MIPRIISAMVLRIFIPNEMIFQAVLLCPLPLPWQSFILITSRRMHLPQFESWGFFTTIRSRILRNFLQSPAIGTLGSGVSVIHNVLAGRMKRKGRTTTGSITYNGRSLSEIKAGRLITVVQSNDEHLAQFTVRETLEFARECSQYYRSHHYPEELKAIVGEALKEGQDPKLETNLSMMGLKRVAERPVGNPMIPSITEAERHRLTVAEMMAGTYAVYMFDQLNRGMDDNVTFDLVTSIRIFTRVRGTTVVASLIQPSQGVFDQFDRIIMLDQGHVVYQGPRQDVLPYFASLG